MDESGRTSKKTGYRFPDIGSLESWPCNVDEGITVVERILSRRQSARQRVLVLCSADGWLEVYGDRLLSVHVEDKLWAVDPISADLAEQYLDATLPKNYRRLYLPVNLRFCHKIRKRTAASELLWRERQAWIGCFKEYAAQAAGGER